MHPVVTGGCSKQDCASVFCSLQSLLSSGHTVASGPVVSAPPALTRDAINVEVRSTPSVVFPSLTGIVCASLHTLFKSFLN